MLGGSVTLATILTLSNAILMYSVTPFLFIFGVNPCLNPAFKETAFVLLGIGYFGPLVFGLFIMYLMYYFGKVLNEQTFEESEADTES